MKTKLVPVLSAFLIFLFVSTGTAAIFPIYSSEWPKVFDVQLEQKGSFALFQWKAISEPKEVYYEIESSTDAVNFKTAAIMLGGFSADQYFTYSFKIKHIPGIKSYYRIKQINNDGSFRIVSERSL